MLAKKVSSKLSKSSNFVVRNNNHLLRKKQSYSLSSHSLRSSPFSFHSSRISSAPQKKNNFCFSPHNNNRQMSTAKKNLNISLKGKTVFITGASRGIGRSIALACAREGANIAIAAKTAEPHPKLPGTVFTVAKEIEALGAQALPLVVDIRDEEQVEKGVKKTVATFGGIDILVNNASAIWLKPTPETPIKRFDLMMGINTRGTYLCSYLCLPYLKESAQKGRNPHILNLGPPLSMQTKWFENHTAYSIAKYGMSMCTLGMSGELRGQIAVNSLWPRTGISTAAIEFISGPDQMNICRKEDIMSDAAILIFKQDSNTSGNMFIDDQVLVDYLGMTREDLKKYAVDPDAPALMPDFFVDDPEPVFPPSKL